MAMLTILILLYYSPRHKTNANYENLVYDKVDREKSD